MVPKYLFKRIRLYGVCCHDISSIEDEGNQHGTDSYIQRGLIFYTGIFKQLIRLKLVD